MDKPAGLFRGGEMMRMIAMCGTLLLLGALIVQLRPVRTATEVVPPPAATAASAANGLNVGQTLAPRLTETDLSTGDIPDDQPNTDLDPDERKEALREFDLVTDRTAEMQKLDMYTYERLLRWSQHLDETVPFKRTKSVDYLQLVNDPAKYRGVLTRLDLNVYRVMECDMPANNMGLTKVYEIWGWTEDTGAYRLYNCVTAHLPPGMPTGSNVRAYCTYYGYFFKSAAYLEAGAKPGAAFRPAPVFVGRVLWPVHSESIPRYDENPWVWVGIGGVVLVIFGIAAWRMLSGATRSRPLVLPKSSAAALGEWLDQRSPGAEEPPPGGHSSSYPDFPPQPHQLN